MEEKNKKTDNSRLEEKKIKESEYIGKKFEDLMPDEMDKLQGSGGDMEKRDITTILTLLSKDEYKC